MECVYIQFYVNLVKTHTHTDNETTNELTKRAHAQCRYSYKVCVVCCILFKRNMCDEDDERLTRDKILNTR